MARAERLVAPLTDALLIAAGLWALPVLSAPFRAPHWTSLLLVCLAYLALCAGVWLLKLIERPALAVAPAPSLPRWLRTADEGEDGGGCLGFLSFVFAVFTLAMLLGTMGMALSGPTAGAWYGFPTQHPWLCALLILLMLAWVIVFPAVAAAQPKPRLKPGTGAALAARTFGLLAINAMLLLTTAWLSVALNGLALPQWAGGFRMLLAASCYAVLLLSYGPPRLAVVGIDGDRLSFATFLFALAVLAWLLFS